MNVKDANDHLVFESLLAMYGSEAERDDWERKVQAFKDQVSTDFGKDYEEIADDEVLSERAVALLEVSAAAARAPYGK